MVNIMKKPLLIFIIMFLMIGACGCGMKQMKTERELVVPYLQSKYEETFTLVSYEARSIDIPYDEAVCVNETGQKIKVYIDYNEEDIVLSDDYYGILSMPQYYEKFRKILEAHNINCKLFTQFTANYFDSEFNHTTLISQAMKDKKEQFYTRSTLFISDSEHLDADKFDELCSALLSENMTMYLAVYMVDENTYSTLDVSQKASMYIHSENGDKPLYEEIVK